FEEIGRKNPTSLSRVDQYSKYSKVVLQARDETTGVSSLLSNLNDLVIDLRNASKVCTSKRIQISVSARWLKKIKAKIKDLEARLTKLENAKYQREALASPVRPEVAVKVQTPTNERKAAHNLAKLAREITSLMRKAGIDASIDGSLSAADERRLELSPDEKQNLQLILVKLGTLERRLRSKNLGEFGTYEAQGEKPYEVVLEDPAKPLDMKKTIKWTESVLADLKTALDPEKRQAKYVDTTERQAYGLETKALIRREALIEAVALIEPKLAELRVGPRASSQKGGSPDFIRPQKGYAQTSRPTKSTNRRYESDLRYVPGSPFQPVLSGYSSTPGMFGIFLNFMGTPYDQVPVIKNPRSSSKKKPATRRQVKQAWEYY
ncbi:hypothetical protein HZC08_00695, partial [Candidatus Micrarchaeota archaeon]|nr:hypothetical protein [Candidatus Micrarchaeota archaeon]